jgi:hypothetical protein
MCSEVLSWRDENFWERKSIPLLGHSFSPRQLALLGLFGTAGYVMSYSISTHLFGMIYVGKSILVFSMLAVGFVLGSHRVKMIPIELQLYLKILRPKELEPKDYRNHTITNNSANGKV